MNGGESGAAIVPGDPDKSLLIEYIAGEKPEMPKGGRGIERTTRWPWSAIGSPAAPPRRPTWCSEDTQRAGPDWWAFQPIVRPAVPKVKDQPGRSGPLDQFVLARLEAAGLEPSPPADKLALLRRAPFDLIGLPPTPEKWTRFAPTTPAEAFAKVVDRLLASPPYGERWGRHWLDVVHYGDTHGFESDQRGPTPGAIATTSSLPSIATSRSISSSREQLAGDVLAPDDPQAIAALGFLGNGPWDKTAIEAKRDRAPRPGRRDRRHRGTWWPPPRWG